MPRIRGKVVSKAAKFGWEIMVTFEPDEVIADLPAIDGEMLMTPESLNLTSGEQLYDTRASAKDALSEAANEIFRVIMEKIGDPSARMLDLKTGKEGLRVERGRVV